MSSLDRSQISKYYSEITIWSYGYRKIFLGQKIALFVESPIYHALTRRKYLNITVSGSPYTLSWEYGIYISPSVRHHFLALCNSPTLHNRIDLLIFHCSFFYVVEQFLIRWYSGIFIISWKLYCMGILLNGKRKKKKYIKTTQKEKDLIWFDLIFGVLTLLSTIFQLYHGDQF